jgi:hypothetical protein
MSNNGSDNPKFTACYDPHGQPSLIHFKDYMQNVTPPARLHIPLGLGGNHITGLVVDIDVHGKSDVLFFNSLGSSGVGPYQQEAQLFMDAVREKFPKKNDYYVNKKFQVGAGDNFCGDWSMWFLRNAASTPSSSLGEIQDRLNNLGSSVTPDPRALRASHIDFLDQYRAQLAGPGPERINPNPTPIPAAPPPKIAIANKAEAELYVATVLKSGTKTVDIDGLVDKSSKKFVLNAYVSHAAQHPEQGIKLSGANLMELGKEVYKENQQNKARQIVSDYYRTGEIDLDRFPNPDLKKKILKTFLIEFAMDPSKGQPPKFTGHGIVALNREVQHELNIEKHGHSKHANPSDPGFKHQMSIKTPAQAQGFIEESLKSGAKSIDLDSLANRVSKKRVIEAFIDFAHNHPDSGVNLTGTGANDLVKEVRREMKLDVPTVEREHQHGPNLK